MADIPALWLMNCLRPQLPASRCLLLQIPAESVAQSGRVTVQLEVLSRSRSQVSRQVRLGVGHPFGAHDQNLIFCFVRQLL
jgi:hypothetical protein